jgi:hypothetical protein
MVLVGTPEIKMTSYVSLTQLHSKQPNSIKLMSLPQEVLQIPVQTEIFHTIFEILVGPRGKKI